MEKDRPGRGPSGHQEIADPQRQEGYPSGSESWPQEAQWLGREPQGGESWGDDPGYGRAQFGERSEIRGAPYPGHEGQPFQQSARHQGFGHGGFDHPRHRTDWGEIGRSSVYNQPPGSYGAYPSGTESAGMARTRRGPKGYVRSDERIREFICERLTQYHAVDVSDVSVEVRDGCVILEGSVPERRMKHAIEDVADDCWGVKDVDNRLRVRTSREVGQRETQAQMAAAVAPISAGQSMSGGMPMSTGDPLLHPGTPSSASVASGQAAPESAAHGKRQSS